MSERDETGRMPVLKSVSVNLQVGSNINELIAFLVHLATIIRAGEPFKVTIEPGDDVETTA